MSSKKRKLSEASSSSSFSSSSSSSSRKKQGNALSVIHGDSAISLKDAHSTSKQLFLFRFPEVFDVVKFSSLDLHIPSQPLPANSLKPRTISSFTLDKRYTVVEVPSAEAQGIISVFPQKANKGDNNDTGADEDSDSDDALDKDIYKDFSDSEEEYADKKERKLAKKARVLPGKPFTRVFHVFEDSFRNNLVHEPCYDLQEPPPVQPKGLGLSFRPIGSRAPLVSSRGAGTPDEKNAEKGEWERQEKKKDKKEKKEKNTKVKSASAE